MPAAYVDENTYIRYDQTGKIAIQSWHVDEIREMVQQCSTIAKLSLKLGYKRKSNLLEVFLNKHQILFGVRKNYLAYIGQDGKWYKQCSKTKKVFGPVDSLEELGEWFSKGKSTDGFRSKCKEVDKQYRQENKDKIKQWYQSPAGLFSHYKQSAKKRGINCTLTEEWFEEQMKLPQFNICAVSGRTFVDEPNHPHSRTLDRISSTKGYTPDNVKWVCLIYNSWKNDLKLQEIFEIAKYMCEHYNIDPVKYMESIVYGKDNPHLAAK